MYATGSNTFFGRAAALIAGTNAVANIQKVSSGPVYVSVLVHVHVVVPLPAAPCVCPRSVDGTKPAAWMQLKEQCPGAMCIAAYCRTPAGVSVM